jgi:hypothetical protein
MLDFGGVYWPIASIEIPRSRHYGCKVDPFNFHIFSNPNSNPNFMAFVLIINWTPKVSIESLKKKFTSLNWKDTKYFIDPTPWLQSGLFQLSYFSYLTPKVLRQPKWLFAFLGRILWMHSILGFFETFCGSRYGWQLSNEPLHVSFGFMV